MDVRIDEVVSEITVAGNLGPLSADEVKRIVRQVMDLLKDEAARKGQRERDTTITNRAFHRPG